METSSSICFSEAHLCDSHLALTFSYCIRWVSSRARFTLNVRHLRYIAKTSCVT